MLRFLVEYAAVVIVATVLMYGLAFWRGVDGMPRQGIDADNVAWTCYDDPLNATTPIGVRGDGHLCFAQSGVRATVDVEDLVPGEMYTAWLAYIDSPAACTADPCR